MQQRVRRANLSAFRACNVDSDMHGCLLDQRFAHEIQGSSANDRPDKRAIEQKVECSELRF